MNNASALLQVQGLTFSHPGRPVFLDWSASVGAGATLVCGGESSGKTTLLRLLAADATLYVKVTARDASNPQQFADVTYTLFVKAGEDAPEVPSDTGFTAAPADVLLGAAAAGCSLAGDGVGHCVLVALLALVAGMRVFKRLGRTRTAFERACCL